MSCGPARSSPCLLVAALVVCSPALFAERARAARAVRYEVDAEIDVGSGRVVERVSIDVEVGEGEREVRLWLYGDRLAVAPSAMEERSARWIYPEEVDLGAMTVRGARVDGRPTDLARVALEASAQPGRMRDAGGSDVVVSVSAGVARRVRLELSVELRVPGRFGRLGRAAGRLSLAAPWYPLVLDGETWTSSAEHDVSVRAPGAMVSAGGLHPDAVGLGPAVQVVARTAYVPILAAPRLRTLRASLPAGRSLVLVDHGDGDVPPPRAARGEHGLADLAGVDRLGLIAEAATDAVRTSDWLGVPVPERIVVLVVPSRTELAASAPGTVLVSDRIFQVFPVDDLRETHRRAVRRAVFQRLGQELAEVDPPADRLWSEDLRAAVLVHLDERRRRGSARRVEDVLQPFSFHPAVDQLLYAPQVAFEDVYFGSVDEPDPFRDDPHRAREPVARGQRMFASIADVLGPERTERFVAMLVRARRSARAALERVLPGASERLTTWTRYPSLEVNYRLGDVRTEPLERGFRHTITVYRDGAARREPVEVEVEDASGARRTAVWDADGAVGMVVIETDGPLARVAIDPRERIAQSARIADGHPRGDDASSQPWRLPMFNNFSLDLLLSEGNFTGLADITLRRRYDLEHTLIFRIARSVARTTGRIRYLQGVGPKVHNNRRSFQLGGGLAFSRIEPGFVTSALGGWALELELVASVGTQRFIADPREGVTAFVQLQGGGTVRDDGVIAGTARGTFRVSGIVPVGLRNAFFFLAAAGFTAGAALDADRQILGGRYGLRGFANDELVGNGIVFAVAEHRGTVLGDLAVNLLHGVWVREVQVATWVGAGGVFDGPRGEAARFAVEGGMGLRFHYEYGGVQPGVLALDFGVPVSRLASGGDGPPIAFYASFDQYY